MGIPESCGSSVKNGDFEALAPGILIQKVWSQGICIFTNWVWKPILSWALEDKRKHRHALHFKVRLGSGFQHFGRLDVVDGLRTLSVQDVAVVQLLGCVWLFCDPVDYSLPGSSVEISQAGILEWVAISFSRGSSQPRDRTCISCFGRWVLYHWAAREAHGSGHWHAMKNTKNIICMYSWALRNWREITGTKDEDWWAVLKVLWFGEHLLGFIGCACWERVCIQTHVHWDACKFSPAGKTHTVWNCSVNLGPTGSYLPCRDNQEICQSCFLLYTCPSVGEGVLKVSPWPCTHRLVLTWVWVWIYSAWVVCLCNFKMRN